MARIGARDKVEHLLLRGDARARVCELRGEVDLALRTAIDCPELGEGEVRDEAADVGEVGVARESRGCILALLWDDVLVVPDDYDAILQAGLVTRFISQSTVTCMHLGDAVIHLQRLGAVDHTPCERGKRRLDSVASSATVRLRYAFSYERGAHSDTFNNMHECRTRLHGARRGRRDRQRLASMGRRRPSQ